MEFGEYIKQRRERMSLTLISVARRIGMNHNHFNAIELQNKPPMSDRYMPALARVLEVQPGKLVALSAIKRRKITLRFETDMHTSTGAMLAEYWSDLGTTTLREIDAVIWRHVERAKRETK